MHGGKYYEETTGAVSIPIYQSATFRHPGLGESTGYDYSRLQNPTREELENIIANLEDGKYGFAFSSGMAAISTILKLFKPGEHIIFSDDLYGGTFRIAQEVYKKYGIEFTYVDSSVLDNVNNALKTNTKAIFIETPSNPVMKVSDIAAIAKIAKANGCILIVDNTFMTPINQRPLNLGADIVVHSGTKYLGGHNDTLAGLIVTSSDEINDTLKLIQKSEGAVLSPFDSWLIIRGIKTLSVRLEKQQSNAIIIANWLKENNKVEKVYFVGLPEHEGYAISKKQTDGFGAMISFTVKDERLVSNILKKLKVILFAESLGGVESLITYPMLQTHADVPKEIRESLGINEKLLRLSVGIENAQDLIDDLNQAFSI